MLFAGSSGSEGKWEQIQEGSLKGVSIFRDASTEDITKLSTGPCRDVERWKLMPPLDAYPTLIHLDLHKSRYMKIIHPSVGNLPNLKQLTITRCENLETLPDSIGQLQQLEEVSVR